jgi:hypothetical protein
LLLDGLFLPRELAPPPFLFSFLFFAFGSHSFLLIVGIWELKVEVSEAQAWEISFRLFPRDEELR